MSDLILFSLNAILVYLLSDWILRLVERKRGAVISQRQIIFFVIFLTLALLSFALLRKLTGSP
jgi:surface polysaccharide O-acyltransferase-like enzyme